MTRFHLPALANRTVSRDASVACAYTQKLRKFTRMMVDLGHEVTVYADEASEVAGELVPCYPDPCDCTPADDPNMGLWREVNRRAAFEIGERKQPGDVLAIPYGTCQQAIATEHPDLRCVEYGIGYGGTFAEFRVFESYAWMHTVYGAQEGAHTADGRPFDAVIPNFFELKDFPEGAGGDYLLYLGRLDWRKGSLVAGEIAERAGMRLVVAGAGEHLPANAEHIGQVGPAQRAELLGGAAALLCPTVYLEPFGGAAIEAMLCGTPVIASDWGAFTETIVDGVNGYRCRMLGDYVSAVELAADLDRELIAELARRTYSLEAVAPLYGRYFEQLETLAGDGWQTADWHHPDFAGAA